MKCPTCGQICRNNRSVCVLCGTPLKQKRSHKGLIVLIVILVLILGGLVVYQAFPGGLPAFRGTGQPAELVTAEEPPAAAGEEPPAATGEEPPAAVGEEPPKAPLSDRTEAEGEAGSGLLFEDAAEVYALSTYTLALCRDGTVKVAGQCASPEFGFDLFDWANIKQLIRW